MKRMCMFLAVVAALVQLGAAVASAQSLVDVARKEDERRKALGKATKVYTNEDVKSTRPLTTAAARPAEKSPGAGGAAAGQAAGSADRAGAPTTTGAPGTADGADPAAAGAAPAESPGAKLTQQAAELRQQLTRDRLAAEALQSRMNSLQFQAEQISDPALKARFTADRDTLAAEAEQLRRDANDKATKLAEIEEKLRSTDQ